MQIQFYKYQGAGNDFVLIDCRQKPLSLTSEQIEFLCHRRFGIGADGLMLLKPHAEFDFEMDYYNSDGSGGTMCGNGGRCIVAFAKFLGIFDTKTTFVASDGPHEATVDDKALVKLKMIDVEQVEEHEGSMFIYTGSPHYIKFVEDIQFEDVYNEGRRIRYSDTYKEEGTNVNFVSRAKNGINVRTYERGVEDETYACGTGSVAAAIAFYKKFTPSSTEIPVKVKGGNLEVSFQESGNKFTNVFLKGPAQLVFKGEIEI